MGYNSVQINYHLLVLVHGLHGTIYQFDHVCKELQQRGALILDKGGRPFSITIDSTNYVEQGSVTVVVYRTNTNQQFFTYDGIDVCGMRVANEILNQIAMLTSDSSRVVKLSITGYSLGGLISRYAVGILYRQGTLHDIEPVVFTTFATPHIGVALMGNRLRTRMFNFIGSLVHASTTRQLFLRDKFYATSRPLLECMADPGLPFFKGLDLFKRKVMYANVANDHLCAWYTSSASSFDPFAGNTQHIRGPYIDGYKPIIDLNEKLIICSPPEEHQQKDGQDIKANIWAKVFGTIARVLIRQLTFIYFLGRSTYQSIKSIFRQGAFWRTTGRVNFIDGDYTITEADDVAETIYGALSEDDPSSILPLNPVQKRTIDRLNQLSWEKYPVFISKTRWAHAAILYREQRADFEEGKVAINHWIDEVLRL